MRRMTVLTLLVLGIPALALAHVSVRPRESKPGAEEKYTVRVPTEGTVATTRVQLEIAADVTVLDVMAQDGAPFETAKQGDRITAITWKKEIAPGASAEFVFRARNPTSGDIVWKAHQHFSDGTSADWVGLAGEKRPASVTKLAAAVGAGAPQTANADSAAIEAWLIGTMRHSMRRISRDSRRSTIRTSRSTKGAGSTTVGWIIGTGTSVPS